jgi:hypothetical protein
MDPLEALIRKIEEVEEGHRLYMASGSAMSWEHYKHLSGMYEAYGRIKEEAKEIRKRYSEE